MNPTIADPALVLRDIHLPAAPSVWPPAPGWWVLAALLLVLLAAAIVWLLRRRRERQHRRQLLDAVAALEAGLVGERSPEQLAHIGELLRRVALTHHPRREVAPLSGAAWLRFLDATGGAGAFSNGVGRILAEGPYRRKLPPDIDFDALVALVRRWVEVNAAAHGAQRRAGAPRAARPAPGDAHPARPGRDDARPARAAS